MSGTVKVAAPAVQHGIDGSAWLAPDVARARAAGAGALEVLAADVASEGDRVGAFVELQAGVCVLAVSRASPGVVDVDLFAFEDDGSAFATDESPDPQGALMLCPSSARRLYVAARVVAGAGIVALGVLPIPKGREAAVQKAMNARGLAGEEARGEGWPGGEGRLRAHRAELGGRWDEVRRVTVPIDPHAPTRLTALVEAGRCLDVLISPSDEVASLDVVAEDERGRILSIARASGRDHSILACARQATTMGVAIRPRASQGTVAVSIARSNLGGDAELAPSARPMHFVSTADLAGERAALEKDLHARGYAKAKGLGAGVAKLGVRSSVGVDLPAGCARVDVIAGRPLVEIVATLWDEKAQVLGETNAGGSAFVFTCGPGGAARIDVEALDTAGPFELELRKERVAPPALVAHPVAASRLLARLAAGGAAVDASSAQGAEAVPLDPNSLRTVAIAAPAGQCAEVIVALDAGGAGLDLRVVDAQTKEGEVVRARAT